MKGVNNPKINRQVFKFSSIKLIFELKLWFWRVGFFFFPCLFWLFGVFFQLSRCCPYYLLQAQLHYSWCGSRDSFSISCPHRRALVHSGGGIFLLGHQAGLANLLLLLDSYLHHRFAVLIALWVCFQRSLWIFWSRKKNSVLGTYCVDVEGMRCWVLGLFLSTLFLGE